jgi:hypothetical protein
MSRPLILIDVDGVLNPWNRQGPHWETHDAVSEIGTFRVLLNPEHGPMLLQLAQETGGELAWATTWEHYANAEIGARIGLPELPVIEVNSGPDAPGVHPKTPPVADYVKGRPFVWFDDDLTAADSRYLKDHEGVGDHLIVHIGPKKGLTPKHLEMAAAWLNERRET